MIGFIVRRIASAIPVVLGVTILVFLILHLIPGNPAQILLFGSNPTSAQLARLTRELGLDKPLPVQYWHYLTGLVHGNLGRSYLNNQTVASEIGSRLPSTLILTAAAMGVGCLIGIPVGIVAGLRPNTWFDRAATGFAVLGTSIPYFWFALVLIIVFAVSLGWLPSLGIGSPQAIILPACSLGWSLAAIIARLLRNALVDTYLQPYMLVARAKGLSERRMLVRHAAKNSLIPVVTVLGLQFGNLLVGAVAIEVIFGRSGLGTYLASAIQAKDIPTVQGIVLVIALAYIVLNLIIDLVYTFLDPRIRRQWSAAGG